MLSTDFLFSNSFFYAPFYTCLGSRETNGKHVGHWNVRPPIGTRKVALVNCQTCLVRIERYAITPTQSRIQNHAVFKFHYAERTRMFVPSSPVRTTLGLRDFGGARVWKAAARDFAVVRCFYLLINRRRRIVKSRRSRGSKSGSSSVLSRVNLSRSGR